MTGPAGSVSRSQPLSSSIETRGTDECPTGWSPRTTAAIAWLVLPVCSLISCLAWVFGGRGATSPPWPPGADGLSGQLLGLTLLIACVTDLRGRKIRNWTTYPAIAYGLLLNLCGSLLSGTRAAEWLGGIGISASLIGGVACFSGTLVIYLLFGGGAGDLKLVAMLGCFLGWRMAAEVWLLTMLCAALFAVLWVAWRGARVAVPWLTSALAGDTESRQIAGRLVANWLRFRIPLAPFFLVATAIVVGVPVFWPGQTALMWLMRLI